MLLKKYAIFAILPTQGHANGQVIACRELISTGLLRHNKTYSSTKVAYKFSVCCMSCRVSTSRWILYAVIVTNFIVLQLKAWWKYDGIVRHEEREYVWSPWYKTTLNNSSHKTGGEFPRHPTQINASIFDQLPGLSVIIVFYIQCLYQLRELKRL